MIGGLHWESPRPKDPILKPAVSTTQAKVLPADAEDDWELDIDSLFPDRAPPAAAAAALESDRPAIADQAKSSDEPRRPQASAEKASSVPNGGRIPRQPAQQQQQAHVSGSQQPEPIPAHPQHQEQPNRPVALPSAALQAMEGTDGVRSSKKQEPVRPSPQAQPATAPDIQSSLNPQIQPVEDSIASQPFSLPAMNATGPPAFFNLRALRSGSNLGTPRGARNTALPSLSAPPQVTQQAPAPLAAHIPNNQPPGRQLSDDAQSLGSSEGGQKLAAGKQLQSDAGSRDTEEQGELHTGGLEASPSVREAAVAGPQQQSGRSSPPAVELIEEEQSFSAASSNQLSPGAPSHTSNAGLQSQTPSRQSAKVDPSLPAAPAALQPRQPGDSGQSRQPAQAAVQPTESPHLPAAKADDACSHLHDPEQRYHESSQLLHDSFHNRGRDSRQQADPQPLREQQTLADRAQPRAEDHHQSVGRVASAQASAVVKPSKQHEVKASGQQPRHAPQTDSPAQLLSTPSESGFPLPGEVICYCGEIGRC